MPSPSEECIMYSLQWEHEKPSPSTEGDTAVYGTAVEIQRQTLHHHLRS